MKHPPRGPCSAPPEEWRVLIRNGNYSAFSGGAFTPSDYSALICGRCGGSWRTKGAYAAGIRDASEMERKLFLFTGHLPRYRPALGE